MSTDPAFIAQLLRLNSEFAALRVQVALLRQYIRAKANFNPGQLRDEFGRWSGSGNPDAPQPVNSGRHRGGTPRTQSEMHLVAVSAQARRAIDRVRELDPTWRPPQSAYPRGSIDGQIRDRESVRDAANARYAEITRDAIPGANPSWGVNRLTKELFDMGYRLHRAADGHGLIYRNGNGSEVRIMQRPNFRWRKDPPEKHYFIHYYRYRSARITSEGSHVPIPD